MIFRERCFGGALTVFFFLATMFILMFLEQPALYALYAQQCRAAHTLPG